MENIIDRAENTIIQLSTPRIVSAIHIIRISGNQSLWFLKEHIFVKEIIPRKVYISSFYIKNQLIDQVLFFYFKAPFSYTGEDMIEIHTHGSLLIVDQILQEAVQKGILLAQRGEFTARAFLNGKVSIEQTEAINTLINAKTDYIKSNALKILEKKSSFQFKDVHEEILEFLAEIESSIEFPEEDIPEIDETKEKLYARYLKRINHICQYFQKIIANYSKGKVIENGIACAIVGLPNVGKSTLMNILVKDERVIVANEAGTTRDYVQETIKIEHFTLKLFDTAGIRETISSTEEKGIKKSLEILKNTPFLIVLADSKDTFLNIINRMKKDDLLLKEVNADLHFLWYINKADLLSLVEKKEIIDIASKHNILITNFISLKDNSLKNFKDIEADLLKMLKENYWIDEKELALLNERQAIVASNLLKQFIYIEKIMKIGESEEIVAEEMRNSIDLLKELNLQFDQEIVFDKLFKDFCIGK